MSASYAVDDISGGTCDPNDLMGSNIFSTLWMKGQVSLWQRANAQNVIFKNKKFLVSPFPKEVSR